MKNSSTKRCSFCKRYKRKKDFNKKSDRKDGLQNKCRTCSHREFAAYYQKNRKKHIAAVAVNRRAATAAAHAFVLDYFKKHPCIDCGEKDPVLLQFDHVRGTKRAAVSVLIRQGYGLGTIKKEIEKCSVRCVSCHTRVTFYRLPKCYRIEV